MNVSMLRQHKLFSVGLPMDAGETAFRSFLDEYAGILSSVYFSIPLGRRYYSREELENEYEGYGAENKLISFLTMLQAHDVRTELAINTPGLTQDDLMAVLHYTGDHDISPDEVVCLSDYGNFFKIVFPGAEIKYSFNNISMDVPDAFDTVVVGKSFLRDQHARHKIIDQGKKLVLLLNNGCSFNCHYQCGDSKFCGAILEQVLQEHSLNYAYALQSFFPSELQRLLETDPYVDQYRFKISNRPLGIDFTRKVLRYYSTLQDVGELVTLSPDYYGYFCVMQQLFIRRAELNYASIIRLKAGMPV